MCSKTYSLKQKYLAGVHDFTLSEYRFGGVAHNDGCVWWRGWEHAIPWYASIEKQVGAIEYTA